MLRQRPLGIAQQLVYYAIAVPTAMRNSHKDNVRSSTVGKQLKQKKSSLQAQLHLPTPDLLWANLMVQTTSLLLISPGPAKASTFFVRAQLTSFHLISPGLDSRGSGNTGRFYNCRSAARFADHLLSSCSAVFLFLFHNHHPSDVVTTSISACR